MTEGINHGGIAAAGRQPTVLIVEDNEGLNALISKLLTRDGVVCESTFCGERGLAALSERDHDLLLLDYLLPDMNSEEFLLRLGEKRLRVPFLVMSGLRDQRVVVEMMRLGARDFLLKDADFGSIVVHRVKQVLTELDRERRLWSAERALGESARMWQVTFDAIGYPVRMMDTSHVITQCNRAFCRMVGLEPGETIGRHCWELVHHSVRRHEDWPASRVGPAGESVRGTIQVKGRIYEAAIFPVCSAEGIVTGLVHTCEDITSRRRAEQILLESEERFRALWNGIEVGALIVDRASGVVVDANEKAVALHGGSKASILGEPFNSILLSSAAEAMPTDGSTGATDGWEGELVTAAGVPIPVLITEAPMALAGREVLIETFVDVRRRREVERRLREKEEQFADLFENANDLIQAVRLDGTFLYVNNAWRETLGYTPGQVERLRLADVIHPDCRAECEAVFARILGGEAMPRVDAAFVTRSGRRIMVEGTVSCRFEAGAPVSTRGIFRDVTEREEALSAARGKAAESAALLRGAKAVLAGEDFTDVTRALFELCREVTRSRRGYVVLVSHDGEWCDLLCAAKDNGAPSAVDRTRLRLAGICAEAAAQCRVVVDNATAGGSWAVPGSSERCESMLAAPMVIGGRVEGLLVFADRPGGFTAADERVADAFGELGAIALRNSRAHEALVESEERYRVLFEGSVDGIVVADVDTGTFRYANPAACAMLGYSREELVSLSVADVHPREELPRVWEAFQAQARGEKALAENIPCKRKDGSVFPADFNTVLTVILGRRCNVGFMRDVTHRAEAQRERERIQAQLLQAQKMEAIGQLAGGVAHDFNNILGGIVGYADVLKLQLARRKEHVALLTKITDAAARAAGLTGQLLTFARKANVSFEPIDVRSVVEQAVEILEQTLDRRIRLETALHAEARVIRGDRSQLVNALLNLGVNARDAMPSGGTLRFTSSRVELPDSLTGDEGFTPAPGLYVCLSVEDTGSGMDETTRRRIFEPFFTTKELGKGTGLGLASVYGCVKQHDGYIAVRSAPGEGSAFSVYLPALESLAGSAAGAADDATEITGVGCVLLVDDEEMIRETTAEILEDLGYRVIQCVDGMDAVELYRERKEEVDLVILDMVMPRLGGLDCFRGLRALDRSVRVLVASGYGSSEDEEAILREGALLLVRKPYTSARLSQAVAQVLNAGEERYG